jgi:hypothetical protein
MFKMLARLPAVLAYPLILAEGIVAWCAIIGAALGLVLVMEAML